MKGYKGFDKGLACRGLQFEVGKTYKHEGEPRLYESGFHFSKNLADCAKFHNYKKSAFAEIEATGRVIEGVNRCVTDEIKIVQIVSKETFFEKVSLGRDNVGNYNIGDRNIGSDNIGDENVGDGNVGNYNVGSRNVGDDNCGCRNVGNHNAGGYNVGVGNAGENNVGDSNAGHDNSGNYNVGDRNVGSNNVGYRNVGDRNVGNNNTGSRNTGDWNCTNDSTGFFCTEVQKIKIFDIETSMSRDQLIAILPNIIWAMPVGNYWDDGLKTYTNADRQKFYDDLSEEQKAAIKSIPNFNAEKFRKCTGIEVQNGTKTKRKDRRGRPCFLFAKKRKERCL